MYGQFVHDVAVGRHTSDAKITPLATGQVWTGEQSQPLGLIDAQGGFRMALIDTARSVGITGEPNVVRPSKEKRGLLGLLNDDADGLFAESVADAGSVAGVLFPLEIGRTPLETGLRIGNRCAIDECWREDARKGNSR